MNHYIEEERVTQCASKERNENGIENFIFMAFCLIEATDALFSEMNN